MDAVKANHLVPGVFQVTSHRAAAEAAEQLPLAKSALTETIRATPARKTIPSWAVIGTTDRLLAPKEQLAMATRAGAHITKIRARTWPWSLTLPR